MRHFLKILTIFLFGFTIISCGDKESTSDTTAPTIAEVTAIETPNYLSICLLQLILVTHSTTEEKYQRT